MLGKRLLSCCVVLSFIAGALSPLSGFTGVSYAAEGGSQDGRDAQGKWVTGEYHIHTTQSDDAQGKLQDVLDAAFEQNGLDWVALSEHLRMSGRDEDGNTLGSPIPVSKGIALYQAPKIKELQDAGKYAGKTIFSGFEWDMPTYDHVSVGIITDDPGSPAALKAINQFEYLFSNRDASLFDPADVLAWNAADQRAYSTASDARQAFRWLAANYPDSYALFNHPSRKNGTSAELKVQDIRDMNNIAPRVAFGFEGIPGNQMAPDRGETVDIYGGADVRIAKVGGMWDALLGEGRKFWNFGNSDFHFKISSDRRYSSGYWPGEYSKNYTWVEGSDMKSIVEGMRSGKSFSATGDLINALDFSIQSAESMKEMGGELEVAAGDEMELKIRFKSPNQNNNGDPVQVDHVDLIVGNVTGPVEPGTAAYNKATNDTTKVLKRFTSADWVTDAEGYNTITYPVGPASENQYFRLRGTNLGTDVPGETSNGEPLLDQKNTTVDNETRFTQINDRNYSDLWFYSNPIFVNVTYSDEQAVQDALQDIQLPAQPVSTDIQLPLMGDHGASITWDSSDTAIAEVTGGTLRISPPAIGQPDAEVTLTATATKGAVSDTRTFKLVIRAITIDDAMLRYTFSQDTVAGTEVSDTSGNGHAGVLIGGAEATTDYDGAITLDGTNDAIQLPNGILSNVEAATISISVEIDPANARPSWLYSFASNPTVVQGTRYLGMLEDSSGIYRTSITPNWYVGEQTVSKGASVNKGVLKNLIYTISGNTATLYEDGVQVGQNTAMTLSPKDIEATVANYIGRPPYSGDRYFKGKVSDFRIYSRALSSKEVAAIAAEELEYKGSISGFVTDGTGAVEGASVAVTIRGQVYSTMTAADGSYVLEEIPAGSGYVLSVSKDGFITATTGQVQVNNGQTTTDMNVKLSAVPVLHTVLFDSNGGDTEASPATVTVTAGEAMTELPTPPTRQGYSFLGWNTQADGTGSEWNSGIPVNTNLVVYAQWQAEQPEVTTGTITGIVSDGTQLVEGASVSVSVGSSVYGVTDSVYSTTTNVNGSYTLVNIPAGTEYAVTAQKNGYITNQISGVNVAANQTTSNANIILTPIVTAPSYFNVVFDKNGGTTEAMPGAIAVLSGEHMPALPSPPTRTGYRFMGWNTQPDGSGTAFTTESVVDSELIVYAQWRVVSSSSDHHDSSGSGGGGSSTTTTPASPYVKPEFIEEGSAGVRVDLSRGSTLLSQSQITVLVELNKSREVVLSGPNYSFTFPVGSMAVVQGTTDFDFGLRFNAGANLSTINELAGQHGALIVSYNGTGELPGQVNIRLLVGSQYAGQTLYYYYLNETTGELEFLQNAPVDSEGYATVQQSHLSEYVFTTELLTPDSHIGKLTMTPGIASLSDKTLVPYVMVNGIQRIIKLSAMSGGQMHFIGDSSVHYSFKDNAKSFTDTAGHWARESIEFVTARELFGGTTEQTFSPNATMTRGMIVTVLGRLAEAETEGHAARFSDVQPDAYYAGYIGWAADNGIVNGTGSQRFEPDAPVTREQLAVIMVNTLKHMELTTDTNEANPSTIAAYADQDLVSSWATESVNRLISMGVLSGKANYRLDPQGNATRAELAAMLERMIEHTVAGQ
ncbi:S-layer homology domain-containing protein [Paenibacillus massiliensis]|uniref:S-layer homology domain-containing protein n=1 Tax=Paenibacillus massiliensis TaxID=225917 RepID=UPI000A03FEBA|nr:S-layer homology domain-containing protein [Paenibacillus massiliensis]